MSLENATIILLAGGFGKRVEHLHPDLPKPLIRVAGRPFIDWICGYWARQGIRRMIVSLGHLADVAERHFQSSDWGDVEILTVIEEEPLGTGGAVVHAARTHECGDPFIVANGDSLVFGPVSEAWELIQPEPQTQVRGQTSDQESMQKSNQRLKQPKSDARKPSGTGPCDGVILGREVDDASRYGSLRTNEQGRLLAFQEKRPGKALINAGVYLFGESLLERFPNRTPLSLEVDVFPALIQADMNLHVHPVAGDFLDIGTPQDLQRAGRFIESHRAELEYPPIPVFRKRQ